MTTSFLVVGEGVSASMIENVLRSNFPFANFSVFGNTDSVKANHEYESAKILKKFEECRSKLSETLWVDFARYHTETRIIPPIVQQHSEMTIGPYTFSKQISEGKYGPILTCITDGHDILRAAKVIFKNRMQSFDKLLQLSNEIHNLKQLRTPYVIALHDLIHTNDKFYLITEKGGPDLFEFYNSYPDGIPETWTKEVMSNITVAVFHCHQQGIYHRDIKPENILIDFDVIRAECQSLKLCDFRVSTKSRISVELSGSPGFVAPEVLLGGSYSTEKADVWSIGCVMLELVLGHTTFTTLWLSPYRHVVDDIEEFRRAITEARSSLHVYLPRSTEISHLLESMLDLNPSSRVAMADVIDHPWFRGCIPLHRRSRKASVGRPGRSGSTTTALPGIRKSKSSVPAALPPLTVTVACPSIATSVSMPLMSRKSPAEKKRSGRGSMEDFSIWNVEIALLIADADQASSDMYEKILQSRCRRCVAVQTGVAAIDSVEQSLLSLLAVEATNLSPEESESGPFEVLLIDANLPDLDGPTTVRAVRSLGYTGMIIGVTDRTDKKAQERFAAAKVDYIVEKPVDVFKLSRILAEKFD